MFLIKILALLCLNSFGLQSNPVRVIILGDSLTEGYGIEKSNSFPDLIEALLHKKGKTHITVVGAGVSGATSASGPSRMKWFIKQPPQVLVLALGANDLLRGIKPAETKKNLLAVIHQAKSVRIKILLAGMKVPPNYGAEYVREFEKIFPEVAKTEKIPLIPFLLEGVAGIPSLNLSDGIHPNEKGHEVIAKLVLKYLEPLL